MNTVKVTEARSRLYSLIDETNSTHEPAQITGKRGNAVLLSEDDWRAATRRSALRRAKYRMLMRNALVAAGNSGDASLRERVARHAASEDPLVAEHARWALARLPRGE